MRRLFAALLLALFGSLWAGPEAAAALSVSPNSFKVGPGKGKKIKAVILNDSGEFRVVGPGTFCRAFTSTAGCTPGTVFGFQSAASSTFPSGFVNGFEANISISALVLNKVQSLLESNPTNALFFWVIRLVPAPGVDLGNGASVDFYVQVNLQMLGGSTGAGALTFSRMKLTAVEPGRPAVRNVIIDEDNRETGEFCLEIWYTGTGRVDGSWQVITQNHRDPQRRDFMTTPSLSEAEQRLQQDFLKIKPIRAYFGPKGYIKLTLAYSAIPSYLRGRLLMFPRFRARRDRDSNITGASSIGSSLLANSPTMEGLVPRIGVLNAILGEPAAFLTDARAGIIEASDGGPRRLLVTWSPSTDKRYVVKVTVEKVPDIERGIAPLPNGRIEIPLAGFGGDVTLEDLTVTVTVVGPDGKAHPEAESFTIDIAGPATE